MDHHYQRPMMFNVDAQDRTRIEYNVQFVHDIGLTSPFGDLFAFAI